MKDAQMPDSTGEEEQCLGQYHYQAPEMSGLFPNSATEQEDEG
jgi:hypothetical protein